LLGQNEALINDAYDTVHKYRFMFTKSNLEFLTSVFQRTPQIYEKTTGRVGYTDLKTRIMKKNLFAEAKSSEIRQTTCNELGISLPEGYT
jgi:hypothetical protein